jgi:hypothetical protein
MLVELYFSQVKYVMGKEEADFPEVATWTRVMELSFTPQVGMDFRIEGIDLKVTKVCWDEENNPSFLVTVEDAPFPPDPDVWSILNLGDGWKQFVEENPDYANVKIPSYLL